MECAVPGSHTQAEDDEGQAAQRESDRDRASVVGRDAQQSGRGCEP